MTEAGIMSLLEYQNGTDALADRSRRRAGVWREIVGPSRAERWQAAAATLGGEYVPPSGRFGSDRIVYRLDPWVGTLKEQTRSDSATARITVPFEAGGRFRCSATDSHLGSYLAEWIGFGDVRTGDRRFDESYVLRGNDRTKVAAVFADPVVKTLMRTLISVDLRVGGGTVTLTTTPDVGDARRLRARFDLCFAVVSQLAEMGLGRPGW